MADARDSKSRVRKDVRVRVPPPAQIKRSEGCVAGGAVFFPKKALRGLEARKPAR